MIFFDNCYWIEYVWGDNIYFKFSLSTILGLIGSILGIIGIITYFRYILLSGFICFEAIFGTLLIATAIISSFYVNENSKDGSIYLIIVGILIFFYSAVFLPPIQYLENGYHISTDFTYLINPWDLLYFASFILFFAGMNSIVQNNE